ncbi:hypothetical protein JW905_17280 [bacterium]|nr:hypothetical protein [candidate division CSSED10-310 bacterium]
MDSDRVVFPRERRYLTDKHTRSEIRFTHGGITPGEAIVSWSLYLVPHASLSNLAATAILETAATPT